MAAHKYWRIRFSAGGSSGTGISTVEMRATSEGPNLAVSANGSAQASYPPSQYFEPANAFDNNDETHWAASAVAPQWVQWTFTDPTDVGEIVLRHGYGLNPNNRGTSGLVLYSDDGTDFTMWAPFTLGNGDGASITLVEVPPAVATAALLLPMPSIRAGNGDGGVLWLPMLAVSSQGGANAHLTLPMPTMLARGGGQAEMLLPAMRVRATGGSSATDGAGATLRLPMLQMQAHAGASARLALPMLVLETHATFPLVGIAAMTLPPLQVSSIASTGGIAGVELQLPMPTASGVFGGGAAMVLPAMRAVATGVTGRVAHVAMALPMLRLASLSVTPARGAASLTLPMVRMAGLASAELVLPGFQMVAVGTAVVPVTYEAYAVNLKKTQEGQPFEVTQYTNFPFTKIVRYRNDYYGVGADGLYLLGGDTDMEDSISWSWQTHLSDFGELALKTAESMYISGRMGPTAVGLLAVGEKKSFSYPMRNLRGEGAQVYRVKMGKGLKSNYLGFGAADESGGVMDVALLDPRVLPMSRNI